MQKKNGEDRMTKSRETRFFIETLDMHQIALEYQKTGKIVCTILKFMRIRLYNANYIASIRL